MLREFFAERRRRREAAAAAKPSEVDPDFTSTIVTEIEFAEWNAIKR